MEAKSIGEILEIIKSKFDRDSITQFGLWFRGQGNYKFSLIPSIFRQGRLFGNIDYSEMSMFREFILLKESQKKGNLSTFEWLTLMQHYQLPTRLLDWSSNLLVALFFSIQNVDVDGALFILEPTSFNNNSDHNTGRTMCAPMNSQVIIRANLSQANSLEDYLNLPEIKKLISDNKLNISIVKEKDIVKLNDIWWQKAIQTPIAVFPAQYNDRLFLQHGKFTIHGGKIVNGKNIIDQISMDMIADSSMVKIKIPNTSKEKIKLELEYCGVNESSLFPELEYQSKYIKEKWTLKSIY